MNHQERSREVFQNQYTQEVLTLPEPVIIEKLLHYLQTQCKQIGLFNIQNYLQAKENKQQGGDGLCHMKYFAN